MNEPGPSTSREANQADLRCHSCKRPAIVVNKPVYYLPCLHIMCYLCRDAQRTAYQKNVKCSLCNKAFLSDSIFDDFTYDPKRSRCMGNCGVEDKSLITHFCINCEDYLCGSCVNVHQNGHKIKESKAYIPMISRCVNQEHEVRLANHVCHCGARICSGCCDVHRHTCSKASYIGNFNDVSIRALNCLTPLVEKDKKTLGFYQELINNIQTKRRQAAAEFHNCRNSLAHDCRRTVSLLIQRFQDISDVLTTTQNNQLQYFKKMEDSVGKELNAIAKIVDLESKAPEMKTSNVIPFAAFLKAASTHAGESFKFNKMNAEIRLPVPNVRVDFSHNPQSGNFVQFLSGFGNVVVDNNRTFVKSTFDKALLFDCAPKINPANLNVGSSMGLRRFNGNEYEDIDLEKTKRLIKPLAPDELRQRVLQLESEMNYYKKLLFSMESQKNVTPETAKYPNVPVDLRGGITMQMAMNPMFPPNGMMQGGPLHQMPMNGRMPQFPHMRMVRPHAPGRSPIYPPMNQSMESQHMMMMEPQRPIQISRDPPGPMSASAPPRAKPTPPQNPANVVTVTLEDDQGTSSNVTVRKRIPQPTTHVSDLLMNGLNNNILNSSRGSTPQSTSMASTPRRSDQTNGSSHQPQPSSASISAPSSTLNLHNRGQSRESELSERAESTTSYHVETSNGGLKLKIRRQDIPPVTPVVLHQRKESIDEAETSRKAQESEPVQQDAWDDYCYSCNEGCDDISGDLGCCATCPKVFHQHCHIPQCTVPMQELPDDWKCAMCLHSTPLEECTNVVDENTKVIFGKIILSCLVDSRQSEPFRKPVDKQFFQYFKVIARPMDFTTINSTLSRNQYQSPSDFIADMNQIFINCSTFNSPDNPIAKCGKEVYNKYCDAVKEWMPAYKNKVWIFTNLHKKDEPPVKKRRKLQ